MRKITMNDRLTKWDKQLGAYVLNKEFSHVDAIQRLGQYEDHVEKYIASTEHMSNTNQSKES